MVCAFLTDGLWGEKDSSAWLEISGTGESDLCIFGDLAFFVVGELAVSVKKIKMRSKCLVPVTPAPTPDRCPVQLPLKVLTRG